MFGKPPTQFFEVRLSSVVPSVPLEYDLYIQINGKAVLFRRRGDTLTADRMKVLVNNGGDRFTVPEDQRALYLGSLRHVIKDPGSTVNEVARFIKESAYLHVHDLFHRPVLNEAMSDVRTLVEDMVDLVSANVEAVSSLMRLSSHDYYTYNHCVNVSVYAIALAKKIYGDDRDKLIAAGLGGMLHDLGKRDVGWQIINKAGPLTPEEWQEIKKHPVYGREALAGLSFVSEPTRLIVYEHHENFDGTGYPNSRRGDEISPLARLVAIADVFDALTTDRSYHRAMPSQQAIETMFRMQPGKFDPEVFQRFNRHFERKPHAILSADFDPCTPNLVKKKAA